MKTSIKHVFKKNKIFILLYLLDSKPLKSRVLSAQVHTCSSPGFDTHMQVKVGPMASPQISCFNSSHPPAVLALNQFP